ncbi:MAG TPA: DUF4188 domain-containing protein [Candidatus Acidoferrales bacterium]|nr:DUF4188 domain-containing protein [Candidatus Acidoferrales bacterium]
MVAFPDARWYPAVLAGLSISRTWARSDPHRVWWQNFLRDTGGTGFWHETYFRSGGIEAIYDDVPSPIGMLHFAPTIPARGPMFSSRERAKLQGQAAVAPPIPEAEYYGNPPPNPAPKR